ncbi:OsmC family protein [Shewanella sp. 125m-7]
MSFKINLRWIAAEEPIVDPQSFSRDHRITFGSGQQINASSAPEYSGSIDKINPEEGLLAALSSCHMLTFLTIAHLKRLPIISYQDDAYAELGKNAAGKLFVNKVVLQPKIEFAEAVEAEVIAKIHDKSHSNCFIANSLNPETLFEIKY